MAPGPLVLSRRSLEFAALFSAAGLVEPAALGRLGLKPKCLFTCKRLLQAIFLQVVPYHDDGDRAQPPY